MSRISRLQLTAALLGLATACIGVFVLCGWLLDQPGLTNFVVRFATMKPNTAIAMVLGGIALWLVTREGNPIAIRIALICSAALTLIAVLTLSEFVFGLNLHLDEFLFQMKGIDAEAVHPGRMSLATILESLLIGVALMLLTHRRTVASAQAIALTVLLFALFALTGYLYQVESLYKIGAFSSVALPSVFAFVLLGLGVVYARAGEGLMAVITSDSFGGVMARRLIPAAVAAPIIVGWFRLGGQQAGYFDAPMGTALFAISNVLIFLLLLFWNVRALHWTDSDRARKTEALRVTQARLKSTLAAGSIGTWTWDLATDLVVGDEFTARAFSVDPALAEKGVALASWLERIHEDDQPAVNNALTEAIDSCGRYDIEYRVKHNEGFRWLQARGRVEWHAPSGARHFHGAIMDITDRKQGEQEIYAANQRLEHTLRELQTRNEELAVMTQQLWQASKLATMGELAASIAHELNNPLATMALRAELLAEQLPAGDSKQHAVTVISGEIDRMARLVGNLLQFSRRSHLQISSLDLRDELKNAIDLIHYHLRSRGIQIIMDFPEQLPLVQGDRQQLRQVFLNLLTNAGDAMPKGGTLTLSANFQATDNNQANVIVEVSDSGIGISNEDLKKVWDPFFTTKPEGKGTGLGLPICRRTVEEHRGSIEIKSEIKRGTTIRIVLPSSNPIYLAA